MRLVFCSTLRFLLVLTATKVWASELNTAKKGELRAFWQERLSRHRLHFSPDRNVRFTRWQSPFQLKSGALLIGGQRFTSNDERFPSSPGTCQSVPGEGFFARSQVRFCRAEKTPAAIQVRINGSLVGEQGQIGLSHEAAVELAVLWPSGAELQMKLWEPIEPALELTRVLPDEWELTAAVKPDFVTPPAISGDFSFPHRWPQQVHRIKHIPFNETLKGPLDVEFVRVGTALRSPQVPSLGELPRLGTEYGLSCSNSEVRTSLIDGTGESKVLVFKSVELGNQDFEFEVGGRYYQVSLTRVPKVELSLRGSGLLSSTNDFILSGEAAVLFHPGHLWGDRIESLDAQRFGFRARAFGALTQFQGVQPVQADPLQFVSGEARLMVKRGAWNLDEVYGPLVSYNQFSLFESQRSYTGLGFFWGRPLPRIFTFLSYPQYADLDITYLQPLESGRGVTSGFSANFHGKILFSWNMFVEGGLGLMSAGAGKSSLQVVIGTLGGGVMF